MQTGLTNITSATTTTLVDEDLRTTSFGSMSMTNTHASTAVTVELYVQDRTNTVEVLSTLVNLAEPGIISTTGTFDALTNVEVGDEVVFYDPIHTTVVIPQTSDPITVVSLTSSTICELSSIVIAPDNAVAKFYQLEKGYIIKTDIPGQTTLVVDNIPSVNNKRSTLKLKTTSAGLAVATPLTINIT
mgnify:CR=1 FL=1|tara:strand:+ start:2685 stop:3245 length:561 start_codon:yes stop_codon:yes gene_type:complete